MSNKESEETKPSSRKSKLTERNNLFAVAGICILVPVAILLFIFSIISDAKKINSEANHQDDQYYHIVVLGSYENELFLQQVYNGAQNLADQYKAVVELYVPHSQAEDIPLQSLFDYASFVNADGIIAYIDNFDENIEPARGTDGSIIPLITTGQYYPSLQQISFIGNSYWELGKKIADEIISILKDSGSAYIISQEVVSNLYYSSLMNSIRDTLLPHKGISYQLLEQVSIPSLQELKNLPEEEHSLLICLSEQDTIQTAQYFQEMGLDKKKNIQMIGFGTNEVCYLYMENGIISELISVDPEKIGEVSMVELFEYKNKGYANSYIATEVQISRAKK